MEPEIYEVIVGDVKDQIRRWRSAGIGPDDTPFKQPTWAWVGRDAGAFLAEVRGVRAMPDFRSKIAKDISAWLTHKSSKSLNG